VIAKQAPLGVQGTLANARIAVTRGMGAAKEHLAVALAADSRERGCERRGDELRAASGASFHGQVARTTIDRVM